MHTTSPWRTVSRVALVLGLFFTGCCFLDSWHPPFFFNFRYQWLKLILSFVIPAAVTVWNFLTERSLRFAGTACAVLMQVSLVLFFVDRYTVNLIARLDDSRIIYHFLYTLISVFTLLAAGWICARCSKGCVDFALFYRRFSLGYLPLCAFLFILQFFLLRTFGNIFVTANSVPFRARSTACGIMPRPAPCLFPPPCTRQGMCCTSPPCPWPFAARCGGVRCCGALWCLWPCPCL